MKVTDHNNDHEGIDLVSCKGEAKEVLYRYYMYNKDVQPKLDIHTEPKHLYNSQDTGDEKCQWHQIFAFRILSLVLNNNSENVSPTKYFV